MSASISTGGVTTPESAQRAVSARAVDAHGLPLARRLPLFIFGVLAGVLAVSVSVTAYELRRSAELTAGDRLVRLGRTLASLVAQPIANRITAMERVSSDSAIVDAISTPSRAPGPLAARALSSLMLTRTDSATPPELFTADGRRVGSLALETPADRVARSEIQDLARRPDTVRVSGIRSSRGHTAYWLTVPVRRGPEVIGYVVQERRLAASPRAVQPLRDIIGSDIGLYFHDAADTTWADLSGRAYPAPTHSSRFDDSLRIVRHNAGHAALAATSPIAGTPLFVTLEYPLDAVLARPIATIRVLAIIAVLLAVLGAAIAWAMGRRIVRPLADLTDAVESMALGRYSNRVAPWGVAEIGRLGAAFNRMADQVESSSNASAEAVASLTRAIATQDFLAEASRILAASLSDETLLAGLGRHCVPTISDYCSIHIADEDGAIRRVETAHYDPAKQTLVRRLVRRYEYRVDGPGEVSQVIRTQQPLVVAPIDPDRIAANAADADTAQLVKEVGPTAFLCVPLVARGRAFGAMSFTMTDSGRAFTSEDVELAMELARRSAIAIDNTQIYRSSIALRLEAEAASNAKSDFLAKMSHEIRTPINAMIGYAELISMGISGPITPTQAEQLGRIRASGDHLTSLVNEILDLAKIEAGRMTIEPEVTSLASVAESAISLIRPQATAKGVVVDGAMDDASSIEFFGDRQRVAQILANLLSNAVKFTPTGGRISIRGTRAHRKDASPHAATMADVEWPCITVEDTGPGIAADDLDRIFHPFVQVDNGYTRAHGGTGLGLTISRSLAQMMGGDITVESALGRGSRFTLWLPSPESCTSVA